MSWPLRHRGRFACTRSLDGSRADLQKLSNCPLMTAAAVDSHIPPNFSSRAPRAAEAVDSPAPAVDSASCPPTPPYLSTHPNEHLDTCSAGQGHTWCPSCTCTLVRCIGIAMHLHRGASRPPGTILHRAPRCIRPLMHLHQGASRPPGTEVHRAPRCIRPLRDTRSVVSDKRVS